MLMKKLLEVPVSKSDAANMIWLGKKAIQSMKPVNNISLKKMSKMVGDGKCSWYQKVQQLCQVVSVMHTS